MPSTAARAESAGHEPPHRDALDGRPLLVFSLLALLVGQFVVLGLIQAREDAFTFDEPFYAASGSTALREGDLRINYEHPPLPKVLAAIPAELSGDVQIPLDTGSWDRGDTWNLSLEMYQANLDDIEWVTFLYRIVPTLIAAATGVLLFLLGRRLFGTTAGLVAAALWLTAPIVLGYGHLNGLDVPAAFTVVLALWLLARYVDEPTLATELLDMYQFMGHEGPCPLVVVVVHQEHDPTRGQPVVAPEEAGHLHDPGPLSDLVRDVVVALDFLGCESTPHRLSLSWFPYA